MEEQGQEEAPPVAVDMDNADNRVASAHGFQEHTTTTVTYQSTKRSILQHLVRGFTVMVGAAMLGAGVHGYFNSIWNGIAEDPGFHQPFCYQKAEFVLVPYAMDEVKPKLKKYPTNYDCPSLILETIFISVAIPVFMLSLANFILSFSHDYKCERTKRWEVVYHYVAGALLIIGAALNIYSACMIRYITLITVKNNDVTGQHVLLLGPQKTHQFSEYSRNYIQLFDAKIAAGCMAFVNGILYIIAGLTLRNAQSVPPGKGCMQ